MSSSATVLCIQSAIDDLNFLMERHGQIHQMSHAGYWSLRFNLRNIKMFVQSTATFDSHGSLGFLLVKVEAGVRGIAEEIQRIRIRLHFNPFADPLLKDGSSSIRKGSVDYILEDIDEWFLTMFNDETFRSTSLTMDQIFEIFSTCLENLEEINLSRIDDQLDILEALEALEEKLKFLRSLMCFATQRCVDPIKDLLSHAEAVAIRAASLLYACRSGIFEPPEFRLENSTFLEKIKLVEEVHETYIRSLRSSKFSRPSSLAPFSGDGDSSFAMVNILDFLISTLWKLISLNSCCRGVVKDQLQELFEHLRSVRSILKQKPAIIGMEIMEDVVAVVCDAGVLTFSCCQSLTEEVNHVLQDLLRIIKKILSKFGGIDPQVSTFNFPMINQLGFVDFVLEKLSELKSCKVEPTINSYVQTIQEELAFLRVFLGEIAELRSTHPELQKLWDRVLEVAFRVEDLIDHLLIGEHPNPFSASPSDFIMKNIGNVKEDVLKTYHGKWSGEVEVKEVNTVGYRVPAQRTTSITDEVVGFVQEATSIIDRLTRGSKQLRIIVISGMPGAGKTTLASKVYNHISVANYFSVRSWNHVSQVADKENILIELLKKIDPNNIYSEMDENDLANKLRQTLKRRKYLIFLDDVWDIKAWNSLEGSFPDDYVGSRIILTSRHHDVAPRSMLDEEPLNLHLLDEEDSLKLLQSKLVCPDASSPPPSDLLKQIAESCKGLPLTIIIVAGILSSIEMEGWNKILDSLNSGIVASTEHCKNTLDLSYRHLPDYLRPCLLYFGAFREDEQVSTNKLFGLWIAEGFVRKEKLRRIQDVAKDYLNDLIGRSLIIVSNRRWDGGVKACRIHDLLHDFCLQKAKDEQFLHILKDQNDLLGFNEPPNLRRISIFSDAKNFKESKLFCPHARSLLFRNLEYSTERLHMPGVIRNFKLLRVLDLEQIQIGSRFPGELELLVQLAFLTIRGTYAVIPPWIAKLSNLETFIVNTCSYLSFPGTLWNLQKLKNLYIKGVFLGVCLPSENLDCSSILYELGRLSRVRITSEVIFERLMRKFPNIRRLKCIIFREKDKEGRLYTIVNLDSLSLLESVNVSPSPRDLRVLEFCFPENLRKLTLHDFELSRGNMSTVGELPNLEVLKMMEVRFEEDTWESEEGEFSKLRILIIQSRELVRWRAGDDQFECLEKLILRCCFKLEEMPSCLKYISTLETVEVVTCSVAAQNLVRKIKEEQENYGNSSLRVISSVF